MTKKKLPILLRCLWIHIPQNRRKQLGLLLVIMVLSSFAEVLSIASVIPFLSVIVAPEKVFYHPDAQFFILALDLDEASELILPITLSFGIAAFFAGGMRLLLIWLSARLAFSTGADLSHKIFMLTLHQPYITHLSRNSSDIVAVISTKVNEVIYGVIFPLLLVISSIVMLFAISSVLLLINAKVALIAFGGFGLIYLLVILSIRRHLSSNSHLVARESANVIKILQEGLGGIRDVLLDASQPVFCKIYRIADLNLRRAQGSNQFLGNFPRYGIEALGMMLIAGVAYSMAIEPGGISAAMPVLGALALGAQRLLPILQQVYGNWAAIRSVQVSLHDAIELLNQALPHIPSHSDRLRLPFINQIELRKVSFRYHTDMPFALDEISLKIPKGARVGFIGSTGSGKSTMLDLIMGLLPPEQGKIYIDDLVLCDENIGNWQARIAHVPQSIFLADISVMENIAFGVPLEKIDVERVERAAHQAQIADTILSWPQAYQTKVGERGVRLSGGQRQRIGIARALYKNADVIVFDEATSALDQETEQAVMHAIDTLNPNLTILIIAHRLSTLRNCTQIIELKSGHILRTGTYAEIINQ